MQLLFALLICFCSFVVLLAADQPERQHGAHAGRLAGPCAPWYCGSR
jgi:hypothetical protein